MMNIHSSGKEQEAKPAGRHDRADRSLRGRTIALKLWREWCKPFLVIVLVLFTFRSAVADWNDVPTGSMKPTIIEGDRIFVNKLAYDLKVPFTTWHLIEWSQPQRGDVVICYSPVDGTRLVKRVVGLPGDRIELTNNRLKINGNPAEYEPLDPDIINQIEADERSRHRFLGEKFDENVHPVMITPSVRSKGTFGPVVVPDGHFFMMGDNRDNSKDSRDIGVFERRLIVGRVPLVVISLDRDNHYAPRWGRFFRKLP